MESSHQRREATGLRSAADIPLRVIESIWQVTQIRQRVNDTGSLVVINLAVDILFRTAFIYANLKSFAPGEQLLYPISTSPVAIKGNDHEDTSVAQVDDVGEHPIC